MKMNSEISRVATNVLLWYARRVPYHRGKQRLSDYLRELFGVRLEGEVVEQRGGLWWALDRGDYICQDLYWASAKDMAEIRQALGALPVGGVMLDVGANFGYYSIVIAARLRQNCTIHAFEPNPKVYERLAKNLEMNRCNAVMPHLLGLSDLEGTAAIVETPGHSGAAWLTAGDDVSVTTIDRFADTQRLSRVDLIKIDAEGAELRILQGARQTLERCRPALIVELNGPTLERERGSPSQVLALLRSLGYRIYEIKPKREITGNGTGLSSRILNVLCVPLQ